MKLQAPQDDQPAEVTVTLPIIPASPALRGPRKIEVALKAPPDIELGLVVARVREALRNNHTQLRTGRHIESNADCIRWLLERIDDATRPRRS